MWNMAQYLAEQREKSQRTSYHQQGIVESLPLACFAARGLLGSQKTPSTSPNPPCGRKATSINYTAIHYFFWGPWQLQRVCSCWCSVKPISQPCYSSHCFPGLCWDFVGSLPYAFSSSITSVFTCSHLSLCFLYPNGKDGGLPRVASHCQAP